MEFAFTQEQEELRREARAFLEANPGAPLSALRELGWLGVSVPEERGADDPIIRDRVAQEWIELQALRFTYYRSLTALMKTGIPGPEGSGAKLHWSEQNQRLTKLAMEILEGEDDGYWRHQQLRSRGNTIEAGTSEILRNIIAERVLGLPRSR